MNRSSLRPRLLAVVVLALMPVLGLSAWRAYDAGQNAAARRAEAVTDAAELAVEPQREVLEGTKRLLIVLADAPAIRRSIAAQPVPADIDECSAYLKALLNKFSDQYSAAFVTDASGVVKCTIVPAAIGSSFADRTYFKQAQQTKQFFIASYVAGRLTATTVIPAVIPILVDGEFHGMLSIGIALDPFANLANPSLGGTAGAAKKVALNFVDRSGRPIGGATGAARTLPTPARIANAVGTHSFQFADYGRDGEAYDYRLLQLGTDAVLAIAAVPAVGRRTTLLAEWGDF